MSCRTTPAFSLSDGFDWFTFVCSSCGTETFVGREPHQSLEDFQQMCEWLYGTPPVCSACARPDTVF